MSADHRQFESGGTRSTLRRYLSIYGTLCRNSLVREISFKTNFLLWIVVEMLWFALQLSFIGVMYLQPSRDDTRRTAGIPAFVGVSLCAFASLALFFAPDWLWQALQRVRG